MKRLALRAAATAAITVLAWTTFEPTAHAATPNVVSVIEGRQSTTGTPVIVLVGTGLTAIKTFELTDPFGMPGGETLTPTLRTKTLVVLDVNGPLSPGTYDLILGYGKAGATTIAHFPYTGPQWTTGPNGVYVGSGRVGIGVSDPTASLQVDGREGVLFRGFQTGEAGPIPATGAGTRLMWYPSKAAFRVGTVSGNAWDDSQIGFGSAALGEDTQATAIDSFAAGHLANAFGARSVALGDRSVANGISAIALGSQTSASNDYATAIGLSSTASGSGATAMGSGTTASGLYATAMGAGSVASGSTSTALGLATTASGGSAMAWGSTTSASGLYSTASGQTTTSQGTASTSANWYTTASGDHATAIGSFTTAQAYSSLVLGQYNVAAGTTTSWVSTDPVLTVGNGNAFGTSNAFELLKNGNLTIAGTLTQNSDARLKEDVRELVDVLPRLAKVRGVTYRFRDGAHGPDGRQLGLLAQEVRDAFPELVQEGRDGKLSVAYGNFAAVLVEAVKEQQKTIEGQAARIASLEERLARVERALSGSSR
jgi:endosialidase-like protein/trimeric autotransporter adhesin